MDIVTPLPRVDSAANFHHSRTNSFSDFGVSQIQLTESSVTVPDTPVQQTASSWEPSVAQRIRQGLLENATANRLFMVALMGTPGSGKSVSSMRLASMLDETDCDCMVMPHDGYHFTLEHLKIFFPDPEQAVYRRGAPDTFDPQALHRDLLRIKEGDEEFITLPAFDHANGDPEPDRHAFDRSKHKVVLCEGLYLLHDADGWEDIQKLFDLTVFMDSDVDQCIERVKLRNKCIPGYTHEEILVRCEEVDRVNAMTVMASKQLAFLGDRQILPHDPDGSEVSQDPPAVMVDVHRGLASWQNVKKVPDTSMMCEKDGFTKFLDASRGQNEDLPRWLPLPWHCVPYFLEQPRSPVEAYKHFKMTVVQQFKNDEVKKFYLNWFRGAASPNRLLGDNYSALSSEVDTVALPNRDFSLWALVAHLNNTIPRSVTPPQTPQVAQPPNPQALANAAVLHHAAKCIWRFELWSQVGRG